MPSAQIPLIKGDRIGVETDYRDALPVNMVAVLKPILGAQGYMIQFPGLTQYGTGVGVDRGGIWNERQKTLYRVSGEKLISIGASGGITEIGDIGGSDTVSLPYSFETQGIVANQSFYLYDESSGLRRVTDTDIGQPIDGTWIGQLYVLTDGENLYHNEVGNEENWPSLNFATAEFSPDPTLGVGKSTDDKLIAFGRYSIQFFRQINTGNFLFQVVKERTLKLGIVGTHAKAELDDRWYILGGRKEDSISVYVLGVGSADSVASREVDKIIGGYSEDDLKDVVLESYSEDSYYYLILHLPNEVLVFNERMFRAGGALQAWTIIKTDVPGDLPWRGKHLVFDPRRGQIVLGDKRDATLGILDNTESLHYGEISEWLLYSPFVFLESQSLDKIDIQTCPGHTVNSDATVFLSLTYDGVTWGKEWTEMYGLPTDYNKRFVIRRLGYIREWVGVKLRGATRSRMTFAKMVATYG